MWLRLERGSRMRSWYLLRQAKARIRVSPETLEVIRVLFRSVLRRLAHAGGPRLPPVPGPRPAAARRADQPPRPRSRALAERLSEELSRHSPAGLPRPDRKSTRLNSSH